MKTEYVGKSFKDICGGQHCRPFPPHIMAVMEIVNVCTAYWEIPHSLRWLAWNLGVLGSAWLIQGLRGSISQGSRGSMSETHPKLNHSSPAWKLWSKEVLMARNLSHITTSPLPKGLKGGKQTGSQITTLVFAVLMSELPVNCSLTTWTGAQVITE